MHSGGMREEAGGAAAGGRPGGRAAPREAPGRGGGRPPFLAHAAPDGGLPRGEDAAGEVVEDGAKVGGKERLTGAERALTTARPGGRMRRRTGGRKRVVKVLLAPEEEAWVVPKAAAEGVSVQRLLVESAMPEGRPSLLARRALYREFLAVARDLHGACVNLNQLTHLAHVRRDVPSGADEVLAEVRGAGRRMAELAALLTAAGGGSRGEARR